MTKTRYYGAQYDLTKVIEKHVFVMSPNQSGSTFLVRALSLCQNSWGLRREGQNTYGYIGPDTFKPDITLTWASTPGRIAFIQDENAYDWIVNRKAWYFQASSNKKDAPIFVTKSPPFLLVANQLLVNFKNVHFIFMVRNPYAVVEGIFRRAKKTNKETYKTVLQTAAWHVLNCFEFQKLNTENYPDVAVFFTYEDMCYSPKAVTQKVTKLIPELNDLNLDQRIEVKGIYNEPLRNMNADHINRLEPEAFTIINEVFRKRLNLLQQFGYDLLNHGDPIK